MSNNSFFRPTLLVGVGGTGCRIAEQIFVEARKRNEENRDRIGALVFDTNEIDLAKLKAVPETGRIQFSTADPVYKIVKNNPEIEGDWFLPMDLVPHDVKNLSLIKGAAQYRVLTRLALHDAFRSGRIVRDAERAISSIAVSDGQTKFGGWINILMVGSLAGATGSGSFYQIALMLRNACREKNVNAQIMGLFMMPDVFVDTRVLSDRNHRYVQANAYAALRELNALNVLATLPQRGADFHYQFMPGRDLREGETPFNLMTFIDFETSSGTNMGRSIENYADMMARAGYMQIFTPLGGEFDAMEVNLLGEKMRATFNLDSTIYSSIGVSALNYPKAEMRDYLVDRLVRDNIDENWMSLDQRFQDRAKAYADKKDRGKAVGEEPRIEDTYLRDLELLATEDKAPFFVDIWSGLHPEREDEETGRLEKRNLYEVYLDALMDDARGRFWRSGTLDKVKGNTGLNPSIFEEESRISDAVSDQQFALERDFRTVADALRSEPETIFNGNWTYADSARERDWRDHHIQSFLIKDGPHPVQTRALLYQLKHEIAKRREALTPDEKRESLFGLARRFNKDRDPGASTVGDPAILDEAHKASEQGLISRLAGKGAKEFVSKYIGYYNDARRLMRDFAEHQLFDNILEMLEKEINDLIYVYGGLFSEIEGIAKKLGTSIANTETRYEGRSAATDGNVWVYASKKSFEASWKRVQVQSQSVNMGNEINRELSSSLFDVYRNAKSREDMSFNAMADVFRTKVIEGFGAATIRDNFASVWDISAVEAVRLEAEQNGTDWKALLRDRLGVVQEQAQPFSTLADPNNAGAEVKYWAMHDSIRDEISDSTLFEDVFADRDGDNTLARDSFDHSIIYCVNFRLNLSLEDLAKLSSGEVNDRHVQAVQAGAYQTAYQEMISELNEAERMHPDRPGKFSPHVDQTWHRPGVIPEISMELEDRVRRASSRAAVIAQMLGLITEEDDYGRSILSFSTHGTDVPFAPPFHKELLRNGSFAEAIQAVMQNAGVISVAADYWQQAKAVHADEWEGSSTARGLVDVDRLVSIAEIAADRRNPKAAEALTTTLFSQWCQLLREFAFEARRDLAEEGKIDLLTSDTGKMRLALAEKLEQRGVRKETVNAIMRCFDTARDTFLSEL